MKWKEDDLNKLPFGNGFRFRGNDMTRLETFSDAAFAFATTLLVISVGTLPESFQELILALKGIPAFAASFASIAYLWIAHRKWSRRYGLEDKTSTLITLALIFIMLVYVYPLKMIFSALFSWISGNWLPSTFALQTQQELIYLFIIYGLGYAAVMFFYTLLYKHAFKLRGELNLNGLEIIQTKAEISYSTMLSVTALISALFAWLMPGNIGVFAGFIYTSLPITMTITGRYYSKKIEIEKNKSNNI